MWFERILRELRRQAARGSDRECPTGDEIWDYWEGKLSDEERRRIEEHVFTCPACFVEFERVRDILEDIEEGGLSSILKRISSLRGKLADMLEPVYTAESEDLLPAGILDERGEVVGFTFFKLLLPPRWRKAPYPWRSGNGTIRIGSTGTRLI